MFGSELEEAFDVFGCEFGWWEDAFAVFGVICGAEDWVFGYGFVGVSVVEVFESGGLYVFMVELPKEARFFFFDKPATDLSVTGSNFFGNLDEGYFVMLKDIFEF